MKDSPSPLIPLPTSPPPQSSTILLSASGKVRPRDGWIPAVGGRGDPWNGRVDGGEGEGCVRPLARSCLRLYFPFV